MRGIEKQRPTGICFLGDDEMSEPLNYVILRNGMKWSDEGSLLGFVVVCECELGA